MKINKNLFVFIILFVGLINYYQVYDFDFTLDDNLFITRNDVVKKGMESIPTLFSKQSGYGNKEYGRLMGAYRPLPLTSFALDKSLFNHSTMMMHLENLLYYLILCILIFIFLNRINPEKLFINLIITLYFTCLPVHQEVISCVKSRDEIFSLLFFIGSLISLQSFFQNRKKYLYFISILLFFFSLLSKESAVTFILIYPLFIYLILQLKPKESLKYSALYIFPFIAYFILRWIAIKDVPDLPLIVENNALLSIKNIFVRKINSIYFIGVYFIKLFIPDPLLWDYSLGYWKFNNLSLIKGIATIIIGLSSIYFSLKYNKKIALFGLLYFIITISITSNLIIEIPATFADRFLFAPSLCLLFIFISLLPNKKSFLLFYFIPIILFSFINITTIKAWKTELSMYEENESNCKSQRAILGYASSILTLDTLNINLEKVPDLVTKSRKIIPTHYMAEKIMGEYYLRKKDTKKALKYFELCLNLKPKFKPAQEIVNKLRESQKNSANNIKNIKLLIDSYKASEAIIKLDRLIKFNPESSELFFLKAYALQKENNFKEAIVYYKKCLVGYENKIPIYYVIAECESKLKNNDEVLIYLKKVLELQPNNIDAIKNIAVINFSQNKKEESKIFVEKGLNINNNDKTLLLLKTKLH